MTHSGLAAVRLVIGLCVLAMGASTAPGAAPAGNLLPGGDLVQGAGSWNVEPHDNAKATGQVISLPDGRKVLEVRVTQPGTQAWHVQLHNYALPALQKGKAYTLRLRFSAEPVAQNDVAIFIGENGGDWAAISDTWSFRPPTDPSQVLEHTFFIDRDVPAKMRLSITNLGTHKGRFLLSDVSLSELPADTGDAAAVRARAEARRRAAESHPFELLVDPSPRQTIKGWGSSAVGMHDWSQTRAVHLAHKEALRTFYSMGQTFVRVGVRHDSTWDAQGRMSAYHDIVRIIRTAQEHGVNDYILSLWSPPPDCKEPPSPQGFVDSNKNGKRDDDEPITRLVPAKEDQFIAFYIRVIQTLQKEGLGLPLNISVQNEPNEVVSYEGCVYTPEELARVTKKMRRALDEAGLQQVKIIGPDSNYGPVIRLWWGIAEGQNLPGYYQRGFAVLAADKEYRDALGGYAWHSYNMSHLLEIAEGVARFPKDCWMTEKSDPGGDNELDWALIMAQHLMTDLVDVPNNYWSHWCTVEVSDGRPGKMTLVQGRADGNVRPTKQFLVFKRIWNTVRPGWAVHMVRTNHPRLRTSGVGQDGVVSVDTVAFRSPDGQRTAILIVNHEGRADTTALRLRGLGGGSKATLYRLSETEDMQAPAQTLTIADGAVTLPPPPPRSVTLVVSE